MKAFIKSRGCIIDTQTVCVYVCDRKRYTLKINRRAFPNGRDHLSQGQEENEKEKILNTIAALVRS